MFVVSGVLKNEIMLRHKKALFHRFSRVSRGHSTMFANQTVVLKTQAIASTAVQVVKLKYTRIPNYAYMSSDH